MGDSARSTSDLVVDVAADGMASDTIAYARDKIGGLAKYAHRPLLYARVRMTEHSHHGRRKRVVAQANLDVDGRIIRAQVQSSAAREAIDVLEAKLRHRLERVFDDRQTWRGRATAAGESGWRHMPERTHEPTWHPRPADQRRIIRRKSFSMHICTVDEAVTELELMGYSFHVFTEKGTGATTVVYRGGPTGYRLALLTPRLVGELSPYEEHVVINPQPAPCLTEAGAIDRLALLGMPFLFFIEAEEGRACVLYHRYDGHYGLITPAG